MDDGVRSALAASSLSGLPGPAQLLLTEALLVGVPPGAVTHGEGETAEHLELVVDLQLPHPGASPALPAPAVCRWLDDPLATAG